MSWTDERVSLLKKLWGEGHTAAEIARQLGGVTRNAVIGKAHRMKLSGRVSPVQKTKKPANKNVATPVAQKPKIAIVPKQKPANTQTKPAFDPAEQRDDLYSLIDLQPRMCRWPCGDPKEDDFGFCGHTAMPGLPYCAAHAELAYQPATKNRIFKAGAENEQQEKTKKSAQG